MIEGLTPAQTGALTVINQCASALSFVGTFFIVMCYVLFKDLRSFAFKLVFYLSLSDMLASLFNMLGNPGEGFLCYAQGYSSQFFSIASFLWTTTISFTLHRAAVKHKTDGEGFGAIFHVYVWGTSLMMTIIPLIGNDYGPAGAWCWVQSETAAGKVLRFMTFYLPLWGAILFNGIAYFQVIRVINNATSLVLIQMATELSDRQLQVQTRVDMKALNRYGYYPLILIGSFTFGTINRIYGFVEQHHPLFWLYCLDIASASLMGFFNSIAYGYNSSVRRVLQEKLDLIWPEKYRWWTSGFTRLDNSGEAEMVSLEADQGP
ncbi:G-protein coupled receptor 1 isoform X1 [Physcomitrium patens]|uniref:G-protein coupled receptors family 2 profile 2 domain-containing protein n=1 Tax=Physcomitrium patens TaxID=3218 RepID=A0A7I4FVN5_PHYPA|nr:G-protein coupled receptor 1-like isoform X1 [Physcomitrium patens]|eukprot:XP_024384343.1 G-protein coupled receptor 1-like isoform X1 [Physcomitrella patens]